MELDLQELLNVLDKTKKLELLVVEGKVNLDAAYLKYC
jgi:hypothetical protein